MVPSPYVSFYCPLGLAELTQTTTGLWYKPLPTLRGRGVDPWFTSNGGQKLYKHWNDLHHPCADILKFVMTITNYSSVEKEEIGAGKGQEVYTENFEIPRSPNIHQIVSTLYNHIARTTRPEPRYKLIYI